MIYRFMKKKKLVILGILYSFLWLSCSDDLELPQFTGNVVIDNFGIAEAREYFEANATDLSPLSFKEQGKTKSPLLTETELIPQWEQAIHSGHSAVSLIEVPLFSNAVQLYVETMIKDGKKVVRKQAFSQQRLVIARRSSGETDMFIITLAPLPIAKGNVYKSMENFRYLGGGDFTGRVFCSTLDGTFVKAFGYTDGHLNGPLLVMKGSDLQQHSEDSWTQNYSSINFFAGVKTRSTYVFDEGGGTGSGYCPHGYEEGSCPICMDEVVIVACPYCHSQNGCRCSYCPHCGQREPKCCCAVCGRCKRKMPECECFTYPDKKPEPGGGTVTPPVPEPEPEETILPDVDLMNEDNFVGYDISKDCMAGCRSIMGNYGVGTGSSAHVYQLLYERNEILEYYDLENYATVYANAIACINRHLAADRPIIVGVNHTPNKNVNEGATDHWIVVVGRGYDATRQQYYYTYMDTGRSSARSADACSTTENRLYYNAANYEFRDDSIATRENRIYDVTQVRPNDGQNLEETIAQPSRNN